MGNTPDPDNLWSSRVGTQMTSFTATEASSSYLEPVPAQLRYSSDDSFDVIKTNNQLTLVTFFSGKQSIGLQEIHFISTGRL